MDRPCIKQTVCKVLKIFQYEKYLVAYVLKDKKTLLCSRELTPIKQTITAAEG